MSDTCGDCRYFLFNTANVAMPTVADQNLRDGLCRRWPPNPIPAAIAQQPVNPMPGAPIGMFITAQTISSFPSMNADIGWCGEWVTKEASHGGGGGARVRFK